MKVDIPSRGETIAEHKKAGGRVAAILPIHYPREVFRAFGYLPVEVWGPPGVDDSKAGQHLQSYTCAVVRNAMAFHMSGGLDVADIIVVPNACDSLQGLASVMLDFGDDSRTVLPFYPPRSTRPADLEYFTRELQALSTRLAELSGVEPTAEEMREAVVREAEADGLLAQLHEKRRRLLISDLELYRVIRSREYLPAEQFSDLASGLLADAQKEGDALGCGSEVPLLLSGIVPEPMELFNELQSMGACVVADDFACCGRRLYPAGISDEPLRRAVERLQGGPPDPMRGSPIQQRIQHLRRQIRESGARGVVFYDIKFCEPEQFDIPMVRDALKESGTPSIMLEVDLSGELPGQTITRLEAFVEMLG